MPGYLEIVFGPMFSGKTTILLEKINNYITFTAIKNNTKKILIINSSLDERNSDISLNLSTHESSLKRNLVGKNFKSLKTNKLFEIEEKIILESDYIAIDESQFFDDLESFVKHWLTRGKYIYCTGLIADSDKNNFGQLHKLFSLADNIEQLKAYCVVCNSFIKNAVFTKWVSKKNKDSLVVIGGSDRYIPVCGKHY